MTIAAVRDLIMRLNVSTGALAALGVALDERVNGVALDLAIKTEIDHLLAALGADKMLDEVDPAELRPILAEIRMTLLQDAKLLLSPTSAGWTHTEAEILQSTGEASAAFPLLLNQTIAPRLEGLAKRLESTDGAFLDVGVGVGGLSIAMARLWPLLRVVGIDPWRPALALARENVKMAGLDTRIELREQSAQQLSDTEAFDLAFFPGFFIAEAVIGAALACVHRALRPNGWILFGAQHPGPDALAASVARLRTVLWGGHPRTPGEAEALLNQAGFTGVQTLPSRSSARASIIAGRRS
jgi:2-polyprenyl-3-methyl-5-hydroxy-6-metoxy-1,4-benzoquinol methylase